MITEDPVNDTGPLTCLVHLELTQQVLNSRCSKESPLLLKYGLAMAIQQVDTTQDFP